MTGDAVSIGFQIAVATALLLLGRRLYWVFVAGLGFALALSYAVEFFDPGDGWVPLAIALAVGIAGGLLVLFLQRLAVTVAGFVAGAYLVRAFGPSLGIEVEMQLLAMLVVGVLGAFVAASLFDGALIVLSSVAGAALLVDALDIPGPAGFAVLLIAAIAGISIQTNILRRDKKNER